MVRQSVEPNAIDLGAVEVWLDLLITVRRMNGRQPEERSAIASVITASGAPGGNAFGTRARTRRQIDTKCQHAQNGAGRKTAYIIGWRGVICGRRTSDRLARTTTMSTRPKMLAIQDHLVA